MSARHAHLSAATLEAVLGADRVLRPRVWLSQPSEFAAEQTVSLIGPRGRLDNVRLLGPPRRLDQIEISRSDEFALGVAAPLRLSGNLADTPGIVIEGPAGRIELRTGLIVARRHIHISPEDAARFGLQDHQIVQVKIDSLDRELTFGDIVVRVAPKSRFELHLDTDEANAAGIQRGAQGDLLLAGADIDAAPGPFTSARS